MKLLWRLFSSTELTIILALLICADAAVGSVLTVRYRPFYASLDQEILLPALMRTGPDNMGLTLWIYILIVLMTLFSVNTAICTTDRLYGFFTSKTPWQRLLPHIVHIGFLVAVVGHLAGSVLGFKSPYNMLIAGEVTPLKESPGLYMRLESIDKRYSGTGDLVSQKTGLTLFEKTERVHGGDIEVNSPLFYKGIAFYHLKDGRTPTGFLLKVDGLRRSVKFDGTFSAKGTSIRLGGFYPDFVMGRSGSAYSRSRSYVNPHQEIISSSGERAYLKVQSPGSEASLDGMRIRFEGLKYSRYAVISANRDPGIWLIITGSVILTLGMVLIFIFMGGKADLAGGRSYP